MRAQASFPAVKPTWSNVEQTKLYGPYNEALQFRLLLKLWYDEKLRTEFKLEPKAVLKREASLTLPDGMSVTVVEDAENLFHFVLPCTPPREEFNIRYQQIADWWMLSHYLAVRQLRDGTSIDAVDQFRQALQVMVIGKTWFDPSFKAAMIRDPKAAIENETGAKFPRSLVIKAPEDTDSNITVAIPRRPAEESLLNDSENLAGWFSAGHAIWYFLVAGRLLRPLPSGADDKILS